MPLVQTLMRQRPALVIAVGLLLLLAVVYTDWVTGPEFVMGQFYLLPVAIVTVLLGRRWGVVFAVVTVIIWSIAEIMGAAVYSHPAIAAINAFMHLLYLLLVVWLLSVWRGIGTRLEREVKQRTTELQRLALKLSDAEDAQRRRLAQDIHDSVGQSLTLVKLRLQSAASAPPNERGDGLGETIAVLDNAIQQTRTLTFELYPPMLDDLGLAAALRWLAKELARQSSAEVTVIEEGKPPKELSKSLASYLYRSIRELIANAITHGRASEAIVTIYWRSESVRAIVDDNGSGFDPDTVTRGLGMAAINRRLSTLGGSMNIESAPGTGSRIILEAPLT